MRADSDRLLDILEAIAAIQEQAQSRQKFDEDKMLRVWCLHHIVVIGEAAARVSEETRAQHPQVPWRGVVGMRNAVVHGYFQVDWDEVWNVVERDLEPLRVAVAAIVQGDKTGG
jgi:uncharacterized protein with HEPN domain